ncbi:YSIRK-type signal peptide-containing protein [Streptococcus iniae]|uniref:YSIRK-type signal peptide-containing protein n=1 Tax=Streptococcus iniae TaxID=1346 RepID=UPI000282EDC6|nr:YSIRK-type signal peptide-containing protein [Streptococcus iniae]AGM99790.1 putative immunoglobulin G-binding protein G [Streptococcus iniae SF1]APD32715.1 YSIRK signal domain/LPXTG anchor domain surface protein [Streptococcus iniae]AYB01809.1 YSIRK-type signal peptide-containing protein [Streptococcus iniae]AYB03705.1 YSIRK-type signal peptide-containing protein [Streptococcus iniae]EKB53122.1 immunoglobulin G-binding protein G [Streptococcus iniae 9117]
MEKEKQMKYFLRKSAYGLASVSAAFIIGSASVSADDVVTETKEDRAEMRTRLLEEAKMQEAAAAARKNENKATRLEMRAKLLSDSKEKEVLAALNVAKEKAKEEFTKLLDKNVPENEASLYTAIARVEVAKSIEEIEAVKKQTEKELEDIKVDKERKNIIAEATEGLTDFLKDEKPGEAPVNEELETVRKEALATLDRLGANRLIKKIVESAKSVQGIKDFMASTVPTLEENLKIAATEGLTEFLKSEKLPEMAPEVTPETPEVTPEVTPETPEVAPEAPKEEAPKADEKPAAPKKDEKAPATSKPAVAEAKKAMATPEAKKEVKNQLPSTGDSYNPFFTASAMAIVAGASLMAVDRKRKEN